MAFVDLHAHTTHSDGTVTPTELVRLAAEAGLAAVAVTDHDTTSGLAEAIEAGRRLGVEVISGCEVSTREGGASVHVLGYAIEPSHEGFRRLLARVRDDRAARNRTMRERLAALGVPITEEDVLRHVEGAVVARPHFARAMVARGHVTDTREAFDRFLADDGPAYVLAALPPPDDAIHAIRAAGGVAALAHPRQIGLTGRKAWRRLLRRLVDAGLDGIEVDHTSHGPDDRVLFRSLATAFDLVPTGGSDFHGAAKPNVRLGTGDGSIRVPYETWERLRARAHRGADL